MAAKNARKILIQDFEDRKKAAASFPPPLSIGRVRKAIQQFQTHVDEVVASNQDVCASCGVFIPFGSKTVLQHTDSIFKSNVELELLAHTTLDCCGKKENAYVFCKKCMNMIKKARPTKFGFVNGINTTCCQHYPQVLKGLTAVEEAVIARAHPIISILKLRPGKVNPSVCYQRIRGHAVVLPQNPSPLLDLLPSAEFELHSVIRIVWASDKKHTLADLKPFASIRKAKVLQALEWLTKNNALYKNVIINYDQLTTWEDEFIPTGIADRVLQCESGLAERQGYAVDLETEHFENDLHYAIEDAGLADSGVLSGCLYTDADDVREHLTTKLLFAIQNGQQFNTPENAECSNTEKVLLPVITYQTRGQAQLLNDWTNPDFFPLAFPTLFPFGVGGHIASPNHPRKTAVSLDAWAK